MDYNLEEDIRNSTTAELKKSVKRLAKNIDEDRKIIAACSGREEYKQRMEFHEWTLKSSLIYIEAEQAELDRRLKKGTSQ